MTTKGDDVLAGREAARPGVLGGEVGIMSGAFRLTPTFSREYGESGVSSPGTARPARPSWSARPG